MIPVLECLFNEVTRSETSGSMKIMSVLHKLILSTSKMAEETKQDKHMWKETVLFYLIIVLQEGN